jgi:hypothetical protein
MQDRKIQYNTVKYNTIPHTITYTTQGNALYSKLPKKKQIQNTNFILKTQKQKEPRTDESEIKKTKYTKQ